MNVIIDLEKTLVEEIEQSHILYVAVHPFFPTLIQDFIPQYWQSIHTLIKETSTPILTLVASNELDETIDKYVQLNPTGKLYFMTTAGNTGFPIDGYENLVNQINRFKPIIIMCGANLEGSEEEGYCGCLGTIFKELKQRLPFVELDISLCYQPK